MYHSVKCCRRDLNRTSRSYSYTMNGRVVCTAFFLGTLGLSTDSIIRSVFANIDNDPVEDAPPDKRGRHQPSNKFPDEFRASIISFIESYKPTISHYKLSHAPKRRHLPPFLSKIELFNTFFESSTTKCSRKYFDDVFDTINISFASPSADKCSYCYTMRMNACRSVTPDHVTWSYINTEAMLLVNP